jgi:hypothetical protein
MKHEDKEVNVHPRIYYYYAAAAATGIAGLLHLRLFSMGLDRGINEIGIFFLISGLIQLFWVIPMVRRWGRTWYYTGLLGTVVLIILWTITRVPNPITHGRGLPINSMSTVTEVFEFAFIAITALIIISRERNRKAAEIKQNLQR